MTDAARSRSASSDVRMRGFSSRATVDEALAWLDKQLELLDAEPVPIGDSAGRVLAQEIRSPVDVPGFPRAMMDGLAVIAADTMGASPYNRLALAVVGQVMPGADPPPAISRGQTVRIMTGAPLPAGADAVLPAEKIEGDGDRVWAQGEVSPGKNVGCVGEDIEQGTVVLRPPRRVRPQDVGVMSSIGTDQIQVVRRPQVRIVVTGSELLPPGTKPTGTRITDSNSPMLTALVQRDGGIPTCDGIVPDEPDSILNQLRSDADVVLVSGGSSVGLEDHAPPLLAKHGELAIHGIAMRPSSPAGMGRLDQRLVFLLPGNPVSCLCAYDFFAGRAVRALGGRDKTWPYRKIDLPLRRKLVSVVGRVDYARVSVADDQVEPLAISGASILSSTTRADGFVIVPDDSEGYAEGTSVEVYLYD